MRHLQSLAKRFIYSDLQCNALGKNRNIYRTVSFLLLFFSYGLPWAFGINCPTMEPSYSSDPGQCGIYLLVPNPTSNNPGELQSIINDFNDTQSATDFYPIGTTKVRFIASYNNGTTETCTIDVVVTDAEKPSITCPVPPHLNCFTDNLYLFETQTEFLAAGGSFSDNCGIDSTSFRSNHEIIATSGNCSKTIEWTFSIKDKSGVNTSSCGFTIQLRDNEDPVISFVPDYPDLVCGDDLPALDSTAIMASDNCMIASIAVSRTPNVDFICVDTEFTYTWLVTDHCGNTQEASVSFMMMASSEDPEIVGTPRDINDIPCNSAFPPFEQLGLLHCTGGSIRTERFFIVDVCGGYPVTYRWTPVSSCGDEGTPVELMFNVLPDVQVPLIEDPMPMDDLACGDKFPAIEKLIAIDLCAEDTEAPMFLGSCMEFNVCSRNNMNAIVPLFIQADDNCASDANLSYTYNLDLGANGSVEVSGSGIGNILDLEDSFDIGTHSLDVMFVDVAGNGDNCTITINVASCIGPGVSCLPRAIVLDYFDSDGDDVKDTYGYRLNAAELSAGSYDNMGNPLPVTFSQDPSDQIMFLDCKDRGEKEIHLYTTDGAGNVDHCQTEILVIDGQHVCDNILGPAVFAPNEYVCSQKLNVDAEILPFIEDVCNGYEVTYRYSTIDGCDNEAEKMVTFNVLPSKPEIMAPDKEEYQIEDPTLCEMDITLEPALTVLGLCSPVVSYTTTYPGGILNTNGGNVTLDAGANKIYYTATDECGNTCIDSSLIIIKRNCLLACREQVNVSVGSACETEIVASMLGSDIPVTCDFYYEVKVHDAHGNLIPGNIVTSEHIGENVTVEVIDPLCNNSCWGYALIEDKFPPKIECQAPIIASCLNWNVTSLPTVIDNCDNYVIKLTNESTQVMQCDPDYSMRVYRTYIAEDVRTGIKSEACTQEIIIQRINLDDIIFPDDADVSCQGLYKKDQNGNPDPSVTGVPSLYGDDIYPLQPQDLCNTIVTYKDHIIEHGNCGKKIIRTWEASEWWCAKDFVGLGIQYIHIIDDEAPVFQCRYDTLIMTTNPHECIGYGYLPEVVVSDNCSHEYEYLIEYEGGAMNTNGGFIELPIGLHTVTYTVFDQCHNSDYCMVTVYVQDHTPPVPICEEFKVISLPNNGWVDIKAEIFDRASRDECGIKKYEVRRMDSVCSALDTIWGPTVSFCCDDVGNDDIMVAMRVTDWGGNSNTCMVNVTIQDKVNPHFTCPEDVTVYCDEPYNYNDLTQEFGKPTMSEVCTDLDYTEVVTRDVDQCGIGNIRRDFELDRNGITQSCSQIITVLSNTTYDYGSIIWPESFIADQVCDLNDLDPEDLVHPFDKPYFPLAECELVAINYEDDVFEFVPENDACAKIHRIWTLINWCDRYEDGSFATVQHTQVIKTLKTEPPVIEGNCDSLYFCNEDISCIPDSILLTNMGSDDCTDAEDLRWKFKIDLHRNGIYDTIGYNDSIFEFFPYGEHLVQWELMDNCSNLTKCEYIVEVKNCKAPTPVCINGLAADLVPMDLVDANGNPGTDGQPDDEMVELWAIDFEASSSHICGNPFTISFSPDTTDKVKIFDCDDIGINIIEMWVTDVFTGAQDFCQTFVDIQDNNSVDICEDSGNRSDIFGNIFTEDKLMINDVEVSLIGNTTDFGMSDIDGRYAFPNMIMGGQYFVEPNKNTEPLNGVSTLDLVLIQKHILGILPLNSPYKLIAADVNKDGSVSAIDLIELRKLILGVYDDFPANESWRFVFEDFMFADPLNPWIQILEESYDIQSLDTNMEINFIGMKTGDVNASVELGLWGDNSNSRSSQTFDLLMEDKRLEKGSSYLIEVATKKEYQLEGFQLSLAYDSELVEFVGIEDRGIDLQVANINVPEQGNVNLSWHNQSGLPTRLDGSASIFAIKVFAKDDMNVADIFSLSEGILLSEAYVEGEILDVNMEAYAIDDKANEGLVLFQNTPNPWQSQTSIEFFIPADGLVELRVYDHSGRMLKKIDGNYNTGYNEILIERSDLTTGGILLYELIYKNQLLTKRMLLLD